MLHETTQRRACRFAFLAGCVLPTLVTLTFVARCFLPTYARQWETPLEQLFDCGVTIDQVRTSRPGIVQFQRLVLRDPETDELWATLDGVTHESAHGTDRVTISRAEIQSLAGAEIASRIERLLRDPASGAAELAIGELNVAHIEALWHLSKVRVQLAACDTGRRIRLWTGVSENGLRILAERNRQIDPPATLVTVDTGPELVPCAVLAFWDQFKRFGPQSQFQGRMEVIASRSAAEGILSGRIFPDADAREPSEVASLRWGSTSQMNGAQPSPVDDFLTQLPPLGATATTPAGDIGWELAPIPSWPQTARGTTTPSHH